MGGACSMVWHKRVTPPPTHTLEETGINTNTPTRTGARSQGAQLARRRVACAQHCGEGDEQGAGEARVLQEKGGPCVSVLRWGCVCVGGGGGPSPAGPF